MSEPKPGNIRVWYIPQIGAGLKAFEVIAPDYATAKLIDQTLAKFSLYEYENRVKPDYADVGGISRWESDGEGGFAWYDMDEDDE